MLLAIFLFLYGLLGLVGAPSALMAALHPRSNLSPAESRTILRLYPTEDSVRYVMIAMNTATFLLSLVQIFGSIGLLRRSEWGRVLSLRGCWGHIAICVLGVAAMWMVLFPILNAPLETVDPTIRAAARASIGAYTACVLPCVPAWSALPLYGLSRPSVKAQFK